MSFRIPTLFLIFSFLCSPIYGQQEFFPFLAEVTAQKVHVRSGQSANFESLCRLKKGEEVVVLEKQYSWYKVQLPPSAESFIHGKFVTVLKNNKGEISGNRVNVRAGMGINYSILGQLNKGDNVTILKSINDWYQIAPSEKTYGWIKDNLIAFKSNNISAYQSRLAKVMDLQPKEIIKKKEVQKKPKKAVVKPVKVVPKKVVYEEPVVEKIEPTITATGILQVEKNSYNQTTYRLMVKGQPTYYLKGERRIFDNFINYKVSISGKKDMDSFFQTVHPILKVSKIELVL